MLAFAAVAFSVPALAQAPDFTSVDVDQSGGVTWQEVQAVMPDVTEDQFRVADGDGSGDLNEEEFQTLVSGQ